MNWGEMIFAYCERGGSGEFWAEPLNALTNGAFLLAAVAAAVHLLGRRDEGVRWAEWALTGILVVIGVGSFLFHTYATRWASVADTAPIGIFMLGYLCYALRAYLNLPWLVVALALGIFVAAMRYVSDMPCDPGLLPVTEAAGRPCLNGSLGYLPALAALLAVGLVLVGSGQPAGPLVLTAGAIFAVSLVFRSIDFEVCAMTELLGRNRGTHAIWHMLNASVLYLLLLAAIRHGRTGRQAPS